MPLIVFVVVLSGAVLHASWNAVVKAGSDKLLSTLLVAAFAATLSAAALPFLTQPASASWPYAAVSAVFQVSYFLLLARGYHIADMSQIYPLMRGTAPLLVAVISALFGEKLSPMAWLGVIAICAGIVAIALSSRMEHRRGVQLALLNAVIIACYTLIDGAGVRRSGAPAAYTLWVALLTCLPLTIGALATRRAAFVAYLTRYWRSGLFGGASTTLSYGLALWAMTVAPIAVVAALRETSILFATLIAGVVLRERVGLQRIISACIIAAGAIALRLA